MNASGDAIVVWGGNSLMTAVSRPAGSTTWSAPADFGSGTPTGVGIDAPGGAVVVSEAGNYAYVQAFDRPAATGSWQDPVTLSSLTGEAFATVAVDPRGDAVAAWDRYSNSNPGAVVSYRAASAGVWGHDLLFASPGATAADETVAIDQSGDALAVWELQTPAGRFIQASFRPASGPWEAPVDVAGPFETFSYGGIQVGFDGVGNATVIWRDTSSVSFACDVRAAYRPFGRGWQPPVLLWEAPASCNTGRGLGLAIDPAGEAIASWDQHGTVLAAVRPTATSAFQLPRQISEGPYASTPRIAVDDTGNAVAVWDVNDIVSETFSASMQASLRPAASGHWQSPVTLEHITGGFIDTVGVAMDSGGNAVAVWGDVGHSQVLVASDLRASGPILETLRVPASGTAHARSSFSVDPVPWEAPVVGKPRWSFGDGGTAVGAHVTHDYARPGNYSVTVTQTDSVGGSSTATGAIAVTAATLKDIVVPGLRGQAHVGSTLTCLRGHWQGTPPIHYRYLWLRNGKAVASGRQHHLGRGDAGTFAACRIAATNAAGTRTATSKALRVVG